MLKAACQWYAGFQLVAGHATIAQSYGGPLMLASMVLSRSGPCGLSPTAQRQLALRPASGAFIIINGLRTSLLEGVQEPSVDFPLGIGNAVLMGV